MADVFERLAASDGLSCKLYRGEGLALLAFDLCERAYVLETGRVVLEGESRQIRDRPEVHSAYLGGGPE